jgi:hypothetical protein
MTIKDYLPHENSSFKYEVKAEGDNGAMSPILHPFAKSYNETHTYKGIIDSLYGKDRQNIDVTQVGPYKCAHFEIKRPELNDITTNYYYAIINTSLAFYYQENSKGSKQLFLSPEQLPIIIFPLRENLLFESKNWCNFYLSLLETGIALAPKYESGKLNVDECKLKFTVDNKSNITIGSKSYESYPITIELVTKTGSFMTKAKTTITIKRWYAPEIRYFVREEYNVFMDALIKSKGHVTKELTAINVE